MDDGAESLTEAPIAEDVTEKMEDTGSAEPESELQERLRKAEELANNYKIRAEKAEQRAKGSTTEETKDAGNAPRGLSAEEGKIYTKVYTDKDMPEEMADEAVEFISKVSQVESSSLSDAMNSIMYKSWRKAKIQEYKDSKAALGVSRGASPSEQKTLDTPGLTEAEHKALWRESQR